jgi:hypothetical protein
MEQDRMMVRLDPVIYEVIEKEGCHPMDFTGRAIRGYVFVDADALSTQKRLDYWIQLALDYNAVGKSSKKKKKKQPLKDCLISCLDTMLGRFFGLDIFLSDWMDWFLLGSDGFFWTWILTRPLNVDII